jgi:hypothetical protein
MAARLQSSQQASEQGASGGRDAIRAAQARALQAIAQKGALSSNIRGQEFSEADTRGRAADAINRFNVQNQQRILGGNVGTSNQAQLMRQQQAQGVADQNVNTRNRQAALANETAQANYQNKLEKERVIGKVSSQPYTMQRADAVANRQGTMSAIKGITDAGVAGYGAYNQDDYFNERDRQLGDAQGPIVKGGY